jgi:hypothetical protein
LYGVKLGFRRTFFLPGWKSPQSQYTGLTPRLRVSRNASNCFFRRTRPTLSKRSFSQHSEQQLRPSRSKRSFATTPMTTTRWRCSQTAVKGYSMPISTASKTLRRDNGPSLIDQFLRGRQLPIHFTTSNTRRARATRIAAREGVGMGPVDPSRKLFEIAGRLGRETDIVRKTYCWP